MKSNRIETLIIDYVKDRISDDIKDDFINAAIHFIINEETCSDYDIMRIKYRLKKIKSNDIMEYIKLSSTYGYIIYRSLISKLVNEEDKDRCCEALLDISNEITKFFTMEDDENDLELKVQKSFQILNIGNECNELVKNKFKESIIVI